MPPLNDMARAGYGLLGFRIFRSDIYVSLRRFDISRYQNDILNHPVPDSFIQAVDETLDELGCTAGEPYANVVRTRFGLADGKRRTHKEIGELHGGTFKSRFLGYRPVVTGSRIQQIEKKGFANAKISKQKQKTEANTYRPILQGTLRS